jgi:hypothetical protein
MLSSEELQDQEFKKYIEALPAISSKEIKPNSFKKMNVLVAYPFNLKENYTFDFVYDVDGKIKNIKSDKEEYFNFDYTPNSLNRVSSEGKKQYILDKDGLATSASDLGKLYYKNGYFVANSGSIKNHISYSKDGNLIERNGGVFEYTDYPNTIRQDISSSQGIHSTFRDSYLGKYSSNLLKKAQFMEEGGYNLIFKYELDAQNRVKLMTID